MPAKPSSRDPFAVLISSQEPGSELAGARRLPLDLIDPNPGQARQMFDPTALDRLAADIAERGVIQPITVRPHPDAPGRYLIIAGERRSRAARLAGLAEIPAMIREDLTETQAVELSAQENLQREDLDLVDEAAQYEALMVAWGITSARETARRLHRDPNRVQRVLRLAQYPDLCRQVQDGTLTFRQALATIAQPAPDAVEPAPAEDAADYDGGVEVRHGDAPAEPHRVGRMELDAPGTRSTAFRWRPWQQFATIVAKTRAEDVPVDERATFRAQLAELRSQIDALDAALGEG